MTVTVKRTKQRIFSTQFVHQYSLAVEVVVPDDVKIIEVDGVPKVEMLDTDTSSTTYGMNVLHSLQDAAYRGWVSYKVLRK